ncbi:hypothetical protein [Chryseobacterium profundimaris]|uniref:DUF4148 domain-containing protein n=1 Tax=Chryseobacterium profundimaris TaxID=1387275 RepID=A0ABY1PI42_9FLAO|nr:hypothetical protein [Chryseobacterium profundimaris]SMP34913.1 hypothetical protein SAMN06264346_11934 [Chryseobacterium profundimaris]
MRKLLFTAFMTAGIATYAQERKPSGYNAPNSSGLTSSEQLVQKEQQKTTFQKATEGFVKGMERTDPGSTAAAAGTLLYNNLKDKSTPDVKPKTPTTPSGPSRATPQ